MEALIVDHAAYHEDMDDFNYSQGFYVTMPHNGSARFGGIRRVGDSSDHDHNLRVRAERAARHAVGVHNNEAGEGDQECRRLKFDKIVSLNVEPSAGAIFYITAAMIEADGEVCLYQLKIWEKLNSGYQIKIFKPAPYFIKSSDKLAQNDCRVAINNLMPWMDENYLYYKCFYAVHHNIIGVKVITNEDERSPKAYVWVRNSADKEEFMNKYRGRKMPHSNISITFDSTI